MLGEVLSQCVSIERLNVQLNDNIFEGTDILQLIEPLKIINNLEFFTLNLAYNPINSADYPHIASKLVEMSNV